MRLYLDYNLNIDDEITLEHEQYNYIVRVLRKREGELLTLFNGKGGEYYSTIKNINKRNLVLSIHDYNEINRISSLRIHLIQAMAKGEKMELIFQKATELGVTTITPILTERSIATVRDQQLPKRMERWNTIIQASCEQCGLNVLPYLYEPIKFNEWLEQRDFSMPHLTLTPMAESSLGKMISSHFNDHLEFTIIIGPEGGLSEDEIKSLAIKEAINVTLGSRILRTETAALSVISSLHALIGDWKK